MGIEMEWKMAAADPEELNRVLEDPALLAMRTEEIRIYEMRTTYYDTPSKRFEQMCCTVRRRMENDRSVLCVKAPRPGADGIKVRDEWEMEGEDMAAALPELVAMGAPAELLDAAKEGILPVCGAAFRRRAVTLRLPDGSLAELACDLGKLFGQVESMPLCELELELKQGAPEKTSALADELCARFRLRTEPRSKISRAKGLG